MGPVSAELEIDAPREGAFEVISDLARRPSFTDHFISQLRLTRIESSGVGAGARYRFTTAPRGVWMDTTIVEEEEPKRVVERGRGGRGNRIPSTTVWELLEGPGSLITVRVSFWTEPSHPLDRLIDVVGGAAMWQERAWRRALERLRDQLESEQPGRPAVGVAGGNAHATGIP
jgi:Polyketide cyclase / dehydrase and lipid transport